LVLGLITGTGCAGSTSAAKPAAKTDAESVSQTLDRGLQAHVEGRLDDATAAYRQVLARDPGNKFALYNLGLIDQTAGRRDAAERNYRLALQTDPNYAPALDQVRSPSHRGTSGRAVRAGMIRWKTAS
jgi:Tfp pilus assembly protein PilF